MTISFPLCGLSFLHSIVSSRITFIALPLGSNLFSNLNKIYLNSSASPCSFNISDSRSQLLIVKSPVNMFLIVFRVQCKVICWWNSSFSSVNSYFSSYRRLMRSFYSSIFAACSAFYCRYSFFI